MMAEKVFLNGELVEIDNANVSVRDGGFLYGAGLFETMRCCNGVVFSLDEHLERLFSSAEKLSIKNSYDKKFIEEAIYKTLEANELAEARLRLTLTSGDVSNVEEGARTTLLIAATKLQSYPAEYYKNGIMVVLCPYRQNPHDPTCGHKTTNYFSRMLGLDFARQRKAGEALWFMTDNRLAEGCISNVFIVKDSVVYTPKLDTPVLGGIARKHTLKLASENSIEAVEKDLGIDDLLGADEVFVTNVIMKILPVSKIEKHIVGEGAVGEITKRLQQYFDKLIEENCGGQNEAKENR